MEPQQPANYDFIMNPQQPQRSRVPQSMVTKVALVGGALVLLLIIGAVIMNLIKGSNATVPSLTTIVREEALLAHISEAATTQDGVSIENKGVAATILLSVTTQRQELLAYAKQNHYKISAKQATPNTVQVDSNLLAAVSGGTYNTVLRSTLISELNTYKAELQRGYSNIKGTRGRALIQKDYDATNLLLKQINSAS